MGKITVNNPYSGNLICDKPAITNIEKRIYSVRGIQIMIDLDLASLYGIENRSLRQTVRRNIDSFPDDFLFRLTKDEANALILSGVSQSVIPPGYNTGNAEMFAFTEQGIAMLATVLKSTKARSVSISIMRAFVAMRHFIASNAQVFQRLDRIEYTQLETDQKIEQVFTKLEERSLTPRQGIFFEGQVFDAYRFFSSLIKSATIHISIIDNYVDESVLTMLDKRTSGVTATIFTKVIDPKLQLDIARHNSQYSPIEVKPFNKAHDRFLIIDDKVYHIGASLKDLGKKWFAFSLMNDLTPKEMLERISG